MQNTKKVSFINKFIKVAAFDNEDVIKAKTDDNIKLKLFEENKPFFISVMNRYNIDRDDQEDYLQDFWFVFDNALSKFDPKKGNFGTYLHRAVDLSVMQKFKNDNRHKNVMDTVSLNNKINTETDHEFQDTIQDNKYDPENMDIKMVVEKIENKISDPKHKKILDLLKTELSLRDIADEMGVSYQTVSNVIQNEIKPMFGKEIGDMHIAMETWKQENGQYRIAEIVVDTYRNIVAHNSKAWQLRDYNEHDTLMYKFRSQREGLLDLAIHKKVASMERTMNAGELLKVRRGEDDSIRALVIKQVNEQQLTASMKQELLANWIDVMVLDAKQLIKDVKDMNSSIDNMDIAEMIVRDRAKDLHTLSNEPMTPMERSAAIDTLSGLITEIITAYGYTVKNFVDQTGVFKFTLDRELTVEDATDIVTEIKGIKRTIQDALANRFEIVVVVADHACYYCKRHLMSLGNVTGISESKCIIRSKVEETYGKEQVDKWLRQPLLDNTCNDWLNAIK